METNEQQLERNKKEYEKLKNEIEKLDQDLQDEYKKETLYLWDKKNKDELVKYILLNNTILKYICTQKFRNCSSQCDRSRENIFHCEFCNK
jgi:DNA-binding ferritin-like protein (Dps family)